MTKPIDYLDTYVVRRHIPYQMTETLRSGSQSSGGVLARGQVVWMQSPVGRSGLDLEVLVYVEDIGIICVDHRTLSRLA